MTRTSAFFDLPRNDVGDITDWYGLPLGTLRYTTKLPLYVPVTRCSPRRRVRVPILLLCASLVFPATVYALLAAGTAL